MYADRKEETTTCPRRELRNNPDLGAALDLWALHGGIPQTGLAITHEITAPALEALWVIDSAVSYRRRQEEAAARAEAEARARER